MHRLLYIVLTLLLAACALEERKPVAAQPAEQFSIRGLWRFAGDSVVDRQSTDIYYGKHTIYKLYTDSMVYKYVEVDDGRSFFPITMERYTLRADSDTLYSEGDFNIRVEAMHDSVFNMYWLGNVQHWRRVEGKSETELQEMVATSEEYLHGGALFYTEEAGALFYSYLDQRLEASHRQMAFACVIVIVIVIVIVVVSGLFLRNRRLARALAELQQEISERPEAIRATTQRLADDLFATEWYYALKQRIAEGQHLTTTDWPEVEQRLRTVHPTFRRRLMELHTFSDSEYRVCLLLKLHFTPTEIATALCMEKSSISNIRSRLYAKVFGRKGSSKDWDEFIEQI